MVDAKRIFEIWTRTYMDIVREGWKAVPEELRKELPKEELCGFIRGMMVDAGRSGLIPTAKEILEEMDAKKDSAPIAKEKADAFLKKVEEKPEPPRQDAPAAPKTSAPAVPEAPAPAKWSPGDYKDALGKPIPAYDKDQLPPWNYCPRCGTIDVNHVSEKTSEKGVPKKKKYQACFDCRVWLELDGKVAPMEK